MRRNGHPSFPSAITCCFFSSLKTLLMPREPIKALLGVNVLGSALAGFQVTLFGRIWVTPEVLSMVSHLANAGAASTIFNSPAIRTRVIQRPRFSFGPFRSWVADGVQCILGPWDQTSLVLLTARSLAFISVGDSDCNRSNA